MSAAWRVLQNGAMLEIKTGEAEYGGKTVEVTTTQILRQGALIKEPRTLTDAFVARVDAGEPFASSLVQRVELTEDDEGDEVVTPVGAPAPSLADGSTLSKKDAAALKAALSRVSDLEGALSDSESQVADLKDAPLDYARLSPEALEAEAAKRGLVVEGTGSGTPPKVLKADNVKALVEDDASRA